MLYAAAHLGTENVLFTTFTVNPQLDAVIRVAKEGNPDRPVDDAKVKANVNLDLCALSSRRGDC